jgi:hypothetical protein
VTNTPPASAQLRPTDPDELGHAIADVEPVSAPKKRKAHDNSPRAATGWLADCICNAKKKPLPVLANALIGVRAV